VFIPKDAGTLSLTSKPKRTEGFEFDFDKSAYADDVALVFGSREDIETGSPAISKRHQYSAPENATKDIIIRGVNGGTIPFTDKFKYLGSIIASDLSDEHDIDRRIQLAWSAYSGLRPFFRNKSVSTRAKNSFFWQYH